MSNTAPESIKGSLYFSAFGDAWGFAQEFIKDATVLEQKYSDKIRGAFPTPAVITDDTQMALYVARTLMDDKEFFDSYIPGDTKSENEARIKFGNSFIQWLEDPRNTYWRAPGQTCVSALEDLRDAISDYMESPELGLSGFEGTRWDSKGCGANMRAPWIGYMTEWSREKVAAIARDQAIVTHGHQSATLSASLTAMTVHGILRGEIAPGKILDTICRDDYLGSLPEKDAVADMHRYLNYVDGEKDPHIVLNPGMDMCGLYGYGWTADEALVVAALITDMFLAEGVTQLNALRAVKRAAFLTGDSDSVAFIVGAFVGAYVGADAIPAGWIGRLEEDYRAELDTTLALFTGNEN